MARGHSRVAQPTGRYGISRPPVLRCRLNGSVYLKRKSDARRRHCQVQSLQYAKRRATSGTAYRSGALAGHRRGLLSRRLLLPGRAFRPDGVERAKRSPARFRDAGIPIRRTSIRLPARKHSWRRPPGRHLSRFFSGVGFWRASRSALAILSRPWISAMQTTFALPACESQVFSPNAYSAGMRSLTDLYRSWDSARTIELALKAALIETASPVTLREGTPLARV